MFKTPLTFLVAIFLLVAAFLSHAQAATVDEVYNSARTSPDFRKADDELNRVYKQLIRRLSEPDKLQLRESQQQWLAGEDSVVQNNPGNEQEALYKYTLQRLEQLNHINLGSEPTFTTPSPPNTTPTASVPSGSPAFVTNDIGADENSRGLLTKSPLNQADGFLTFLQALMTDMETGYRNTVQIAVIHGGHQPYDAYDFEKSIAVNPREIRNSKLPFCRPVASLIPIFAASVFASVIDSLNGRRFVIENCNYKKDDRSEQYNVPIVIDTALPGSAGYHSLQANNAVMSRTKVFPVGGFTILVAAGTSRLLFDCDYSKGPHPEGSVVLNSMNFYDCEGFANQTESNDPAQKDFMDSLLNLTDRKSFVPIITKIPNDFSASSGKAAFGRIKWGMSHEEVMLAYKDVSETVKSDYYFSDAIQRGDLDRDYSRKAALTQNLDTYDLMFSGFGNCANGTVTLRSFDPPNSSPNTYMEDLKNIGVYPALPCACVYYNEPITIADKIYSVPTMAFSLESGTLGVSAVEREIAIPEIRDAVISKFGPPSRVYCCFQQDVLKREYQSDDGLSIQTPEQKTETFYRSSNYMCEWDDAGRTIVLTGNLTRAQVAPLPPSLFSENDDGKVFAYPDASVWLSVNDSSKFSQIASDLNPQHFFYLRPSVRSVAAALKDQIDLQSHQDLHEKEDNIKSDLEKQL